MYEKSFFRDYEIKRKKIVHCCNHQKCALMSKYKEQYEYMTGILDFGFIVVDKSINKKTIH